MFSLPSQVSFFLVSPYYGLHGLGPKGGYCHEPCTAKGHMTQFHVYSLVVEGCLPLDGIPSRMSPES